ncbi:hypothetical protein F2Q69_00047970 [Brassica cretica]|uniref:Uncharacterized protein n=1 Tax=Brassica cretica TaxID=69181 RepID=A0A8S9PV42_BRACR|nr:hypothetical protein F2Q69_00047970 [Brassica cretica]
MNSSLLLTGHAMRFFVGTLVLASELEIEVNPWFICQITWVSKNGALPGTYFISYKPGSRLIRDETSTRIVRWWTLLYSPNGFDEDVVRLLSRGLQSWKDVRLTRWISSWFVFEVSVGRVVISTHVLECRGEVVSASTYVRSGKSSTKRRKGASSESEVRVLIVIQSREVSGYPQSLPGEAKGFDAYSGFIFYYDGPDVVHVKKSAGPEKFLCIGGGVRGSNLVILTYIWIERPCEASLFPGMSWVQNVVRQFGPPVKN